MVPRRRGKDEPAAKRPDGDISIARQLDRATNLLALLVVKGESQPDKIRVLSRSGFTNNEVAGLLGITPNAVNVALYKQRSQK